MEMRHDKSMENLEKLEKLIGKFPGRNAKFYADKLGWSKSTFYDYAGTLQNQDKIYSKNGLYYPKEHMEPSRKSQASISEDKIEAYADAEWLAKQWKIFQSLDELFKIERRIRKELGGSQ
jgi:hypothetical protein